MARAILALKCNWPCQSGSSHSGTPILSLAWAWIHSVCAISRLLLVAYTFYSNSVNSYRVMFNYNGLFQIKIVHPHGRQIDKFPWIIPVSKLTTANNRFVFRGTGGVLFLSVVSTTPEPGRAVERTHSG